MKEITASFSDFPYTADPYGYARRLTDVVRLGDVPIGGGHGIGVQGKLGHGLTDKLSIFEEIQQFQSLGCQVVIVPMPNVKTALLLKEIKAELAARNIDTKIVAEAGDKLAAALEAVEAAEGVRVTALPPGTTGGTAQVYQTGLENLVRECLKFEKPLEIYNFIGPEAATAPEIVEPLLEVAGIARRLDFHRLLFSIETANPILKVEAYRWLSARLLENKWKYPIHLAVDETAATLVERLRAAAIIGSLLDDGIGDAIHIALGDQKALAMELAFRIARWYTEIDWSLLEKAGVNILRRILNPTGPAIYEPRDNTPVFLASDRANLHFANSRNPEKLPYSTEKRTTEYPYIISNRPDYRAPYIYTRCQSKEIEVGTVKIGGNNPRATLARLTPTELTKIQQHISNLSNLDPEHVSFPDIYLVNVFSQEIRELKRNGQLPTPIVVGIEPGDNVKKALALGADALAICLDTVNQIGGSMEDLEDLAKELKGSQIPLFLISTHNAGQSWGSYDYWPDFMEAEQLVEMVKLCHKYGLSNLVLGIYTYNPAWNTQNYRLLVALMQEKGWNYPIHLIAPDLWSTIKEEYLINPGISLGGLLVDGIGDSVQLDYLPKVEDPFPEENNDLGFNPLTTAEAIQLSRALIKAFEPEG